jgi:hypothetical protein
MEHVITLLAYLLSAAGILLGVGGAAYWWRMRPLKIQPITEEIVENIEQGFVLGHSLLPEYGQHGELLPARPFQPKIAETHWLVGGETGGGKSNTINLLMSKLAPVPNVQLFAIDPKGGMEFWPWEKRLALFADEPAAWHILLMRLVAEMTYRMMTLKEAGLQSFVPSVNMPYLVLFIDEAAEMFALDDSPTRQKAVVRLMRSIIARGRALGIIIILCTQKPADDSIPTSIRDQPPVRICHRTTAAPMTDTVLGQGWRKRVKNPTLYDPQAEEESPGKATVISRGKLDVVQIDRLPPGSAAKLAGKYAHLTRRDLV